MTSPELMNADFLEGSEAYIRYCSGLAIVQHPYEMADVHNRPQVDENPEEILLTARSIMIGGIRRLMQAAQPKDELGNHGGLNQGKHNFSEVEPVMLEIIDFTCMRHDERLDELNEYYKIIRPAPFLRRSFYSKVASGRYPRIKFMELMDDFVPHPVLMSTVSKLDL